MPWPQPRAAVRRRIIQRVCAPPGPPDQRSSKAPLPGSVESLTRDEEKIVTLLASDASLHIDELLNRSELSLPQLNEVLLQLEMKELIRQLPGRKFSRKVL